MTLTTLKPLVTGTAVAAALAFVAACSGTSPSMSPTGPSALASTSTASSANFSPNPSGVCQLSPPWIDSGDGTGTCVCPAPNIFDPTANTCTPPPPPPPGNEGCTPGYWKGNAKKGAGNWTAPYTPSTSLNSVFTGTGKPAGDTLLDALQYGGGSDVAGAKEILLRAAAAALLNAASSGVGYPLTTAQVISQVNTALASNDRDTILALATTLDGYNNLGCPLDNSGRP